MSLLAEDYQKYKWCLVDLSYSTSLQDALDRDNINIDCRIHALVQLFLWKEYGCQGHTISQELFDSEGFRERYQELLGQTEFLASEFDVDLSLLSNV